MSFKTFNAYLPFFESLHDQAKLEKEIALLSEPTIQDALKIASPVDADDEQVKHPFMDALQEEGNIQRTANGARTHRSTGDACLDLFYQIGVSTDTSLVFGLLDKAWREDPMMTLRIIWYTRSIHRGQSANNRFYVAFCWLLKHHPQTAIQNLFLLVANVICVNEKSKAKPRDDWDMLTDEYQERFKCHGYWKDLLNVCKIYADGELEGPTNTNGHTFKALNCPRQERRPWNGYEDHRHLSHQFYNSIKDLPQEEQQARRAERNAATATKRKIQKETQDAAKRSKRLERHTHIVHLLNHDARYRALHFATARLFADQLRTDLETLRRADKEHRKYVDGLSLAAKWAPTLGHSHDKATLLATSISELLFPPAEYQTADESREHYLNKVRELYRKQVTSPLRAALDVTERKMSQNKWDTIDFSHVPSKCMQANSVHFFLHAKDRYVQYVKDVSAGTRTVSGATLQPHEIAKRASEQNVREQLPKYAQKIPHLVREFTQMVQELGDAQWKTLVESIRNDTKGGNLGSALAVCDMSGSMWLWDTPVQPLHAAIGMSLLLAEFAAPPFGGSIITFATNPAVVNVGTIDTLSRKVWAMHSAEVGFSTDLNAVFLKLLLPMAVKHELKQQDMVKRLFVFSDMEFNEGYGEDQWNTNYETIQRAFKEHGYEVPELVWWNLAGTRPRFNLSPDAPKPVTKDVKGCAMLSGYSGAMFKSFLEEDQVVDAFDDVTMEEAKEAGEENPTGKKDTDRLDPLDFMKKTVEHESFAKLVVVD